MESSRETQSDEIRRNALLDELRVAADAWFAKEKRRLQDEATFVKSVLRGRTGSDRLRQANTVTARVLVINDIESFLTGDGA